MPIVLGNRCPHFFDGWRRVITSDTHEHLAGKCADGTRWVWAYDLGNDLAAFDVRVQLAPYQQLKIELVDSEPEAFEIAPLPPHLLDWFGGPPCIEGIPMSWVTSAQEGACYKAHFRMRTSTLLLIDLWVRWYPDTPSVAEGEVVIAASNPNVQDVTLHLQDDLNLTWGTAQVNTFGDADGVLMARGSSLADGQARSLPFVMAWGNRATTQADWSRISALNSFGIVGHGVRDLYPQGNPWPIAGNHRLRVEQAIADAVVRIHSYDAGPLGVAKASTVTGSQEDQLFPGADAALATGYVGHELARYLTAMRQSLRPCHHLEADGEHLRVEQHPQLVFWDGRPHWHPGVSPDRLGKPRTPYADELHGWWGPDVEHALCQTLTLAARTTPSDALQWQLQHWARIYRLQWTTRPGYSTTQTYAARAVGYECLLACNLWSALRNRDTAQRVRLHWQQRFDTVLRPVLSAKWANIWDVRQDDPRLGVGPWWMPWQQALGAYGMQLAGRTFDSDAATTIAQAAALKVVEDAWVLRSERWLSMPQMPALGQAPATADESFNHFGMCLAPAVVLMNDASHAKSKAIWAQLTSDNNAKVWLPPL
jgi:hypothetical protein